LILFSAACRTAQLHLRASIEPAAAWKKNLSLNGVDPAGSAVSRI
jgi:hypothetical protein